MPFQNNLKQYHNQPYDKFKITNEIDTFKLKLINEGYWFPEYELNINKVPSSVQRGIE